MKINVKHRAVHDVEGTLVPRLRGAGITGGSARTYMVSGGVKS